MRFKQNHDEVSPPRPGALYVHVPFCRARCRYCDFFSTVFDENLARDFVAAARAELSAVGDRLALPLRSVFIGGGTPTALGEKMLGQLLSGIGALIDKNTEFTVEANPATIEPSMVQTLICGGANRISLGVQSFEADELRVLGRIHDPGQAAQAVETLRRGGIDNISVDLIFGIPGQTSASWMRSLERGLSLGVEHLSCYALSFEPGTALDDDLRAGRVEPMAESLQRTCYYAAIEAVERGGLSHYEISNFARAGRTCRHNLTYWYNDPYMGIGPAAAGYIDGVRWKNIPDLKAYLAAIAAGESPPATSERLTGRAAMAEAAMLGLRLTQGIDRAAFAARYGQGLPEAFPRTIDRYVDLGALVVTSTHIRISRGALFVADSVLGDILQEA